MEYGSTTIEIHIDAISEKDNILIVDDLLATGGTASAAIELVKKLKGNVLGCAFVIELAFLNGRKKLKNVPYTSIVRYWDFSKQKSLYFWNGYMNIEVYGIQALERDFLRVV